MTELENPGGSARQRPERVWGREVPFRNQHFTGRDDELQALRSGLTEASTAVVGQPAQPLYGLGGVGKTEIAAEYAHRFRSDYSLVWWVRAEQTETVVASLLALGQQLKLPGLRVDERDYSLGVVLEALNRGEPYRDYLLIFDNVADVNIAKYLPHGPGHVIITSRHSHWRKALRIDGIEVNLFKPEETVSFLRRRVPSLAVAEDAASGQGAAAQEEQRRELAEELAHELGNLPIAAEHAAAYLVETGTPVLEYLERFRENAHKLLAEEVDIAYPRSVATTWGLTQETLSDEAKALFGLLAFFSPEPVYEEVLVRPGIGLEPGLELLQRVLSDAESLRAAARQLHRFSLVRIDGVRNVVQVHRVVQAVTQGRLRREDPETADALRKAVHTLLAASDPAAPDRDDSDPAYDRSIRHLVPSGATESADPLVRKLVINQVRRLRRGSSHNAALQLGEPTLAGWRKLFPPDDRQTLALAVEVARAMRFTGRVEEARQLNGESLEVLRNGPDFESDQTYLTCARNYGVDLTYLGRYQEALDNDLALLPRYEQVFRRDHLDTLQVRNNIAVSLRCLGRFEEALEYDEETLRQRLRILGDLDRGTLVSKFAIARDLRRLGRYEAALDLIREVNATYEAKGEDWTRQRLLAASELATSLRRAGLLENAAEHGEMVYQTHLDRFGPEHRVSLSMAINLVNARRSTHNVTAAQELGEATLAYLEKVLGAEHPSTVVARSDLAVVLRVAGNPTGAAILQERALEEFIGLFGPDHPSPLVAMMNLASDLAAIGEVQRARELGERALEGSRRVRGPSHPCTLAVANNLSLDRRADGDEDAARLLHEETLAAFLEVLSPEHPDVRLCMQQGRISLDISPMMD